MVDFYDESKDTLFTVSWKELLQHAALDDTDRAKFASMQADAELLAQDFSCSQALLSTTSNAQRDRDVGIMAVVRGYRVAPTPPIAPALDADDANLFATLRGLVATAPVALSSGAGDGGLVLRTLPLAKAKQPKPAGGTDTDLASFYTNSGFFNATTAVGGARRISALNMYSPLVNNRFRVNAPAGCPVAALPTTDMRGQHFNTLALGRMAYDDAAVPPEMITNLCLEHGMRPNLHIGRMVYANHKPEVLRFVHVAGHAIAQTVVTRPLAERLMSPLLGATPVDAGMQDRIKEVYGIDAFTMHLSENPDDLSYYGVEGSVLAFMTTAVLHPSYQVRNEAAGLLKENGYNLETIGENLVRWLKYFINSLPLARYGGAAPVFDVYAQGRVLELTFCGCTPKPKPETEDAETARLRVPVMYLGELLSAAEVTRAWGAALAAAGLNPTTEAIRQSAKVKQWPDHGANNLARDRDVTASSFTIINCFAFPGGERAISQEDRVAVTRTANAQDALIAFVQIMSKRFFSNYPELYVDESIGNGAGAGAGGERGAKLQQTVGAQQRALTSNDYPSIIAGLASELTVKEEWELVIVRPNIEHNMLAAILGRGGTEELGSTFWGQTELSCYDDSMHGIWGMSYKYHERAMVTNEKNLIRLFDIAYDGYNGGKDDSFVSWISEAGHKSYRTLKSETQNTSMPYMGPSFIVSFCFIIRAKTQS